MLPMSRAPCAVLPIASQYLESYVSHVVLPKANQCLESQAVLPIASQYLEGHASYVVLPIARVLSSGGGEASPPPPPPPQTFQLPPPPPPQKINDFFLSYEMGILHLDVHALFAKSLRSEWAPPIHI